MAEVAAREAAARAEAAALLAALQLPAGAVPATAEPAGDGGYLAKAVFAQEDLRANAVDSSAWWVAPGSPAQLLGYLHEHLPSGTQWYNGRYPPTAIAAQEAVILKRPDLAGVLAERLLTVRVAQLPAGHTGVRADAQVLWIVPPVNVPREALLLRVTARLVGPLHRIVHSVSVRSRAQIEAIVHLINHARELAPSFLPRSCPADFGTVVLAFYRRKHAAPIATVTLDAGGCGNMTVDVPARLPVPRATPPQLVRELEAPLGLALP